VEIYLSLSEIRRRAHARVGFSSSQSPSWCYTQHNEFIRAAALEVAQSCPWVNTRARFARHHRHRPALVDYPAGATAGSIVQIGAWDAGASRYCMLRRGIIPLALDDEPLVDEGEPASVAGRGIPQLYEPKDQIEICAAPRPGVRAQDRLRAVPDLATEDTESIVDAEAIILLSSPKSTRSRATPSRRASSARSTTSASASSRRASATPHDVKRASSYRRRARGAARVRSATTSPTAATGRRPCPRHEDLGRSSSSSRARPARRLFSANQARFRELTNFWIDKGGKLRRRSPLARLGGALSANSQGLFDIDGQYYTFAKKGDTVTHTGASRRRRRRCTSTTRTCARRGSCSRSIFQGYAVAVDPPHLPLDHLPVAAASCTPGTGCSTRRPTCRIPSCPAPSRPRSPTSPTSATTPTSSPCSARARRRCGARRCAATPSAAAPPTRACGTSARARPPAERRGLVLRRPRGPADTREFIVPRERRRPLDRRPLGLLRARVRNSGAWVPMEEVAIAPVVELHLAPGLVASRFAGGWNEIKIQVLWGSADAGLIRLRLVAGRHLGADRPAADAVGAAGIGHQLDAGVGEAKYRHRDGDVTTRAAFSATITSDKTYLLAVAAGGKSETVDISAAFPIGWEREYRRFYKKIVFDAALVGGTAAQCPGAPTPPRPAPSPPPSGSTERRRRRHAVHHRVRVGDTSSASTASCRPSCHHRQPAPDDGRRLRREQRWRRLRRRRQALREVHQRRDVHQGQRLRPPASPPATTVTINGVDFTVISMGDGQRRAPARTTASAADAGDWTAAVDASYTAIRAQLADPRQSTTSTRSS
jgi:hypothetical protein